MKRFSFTLFLCLLSFYPLAKNYAKYYSDEEMLALEEFHKSPLGQKILKIKPFITQEPLAIGQRKGQEAMAKIMEKLKNMGYTETPVGGAKKKSGQTRTFPHDQCKTPNSERPSIAHV